jgi:SAM-dependent methyltransferase
MAALENHPRLARLIERAANRALATVNAAVADDAATGELTAGGRGNRAPRAGEVAEPAPVEPGAAALYARELPLGYLGVHETEASRRLYDRLDATDVAAVERQIAEHPELLRMYESPKDPGARRHMLLAFGVHLGAKPVLEKAGLSAAQPPEEVHAMARGPVAAAGGLYEADLISDALGGIGVELAEVERALDFGCSSARVLRVLSAAYPQVGWRGCDPNGPAVAWAGEQFPAIDFFQSGNVPPLPLEEDSFDFVYAISIWTHFSPQLALRWFEEIRRVLRPGGHFVLTTHGFTSVAHYAEEGLRTPRQAEAIVGSLYRHGSWYLPEFGAEGDWGVVNPDWGTTFLSPEWMLAQLCPRWRVLDFAAGRHMRNQDVYVLQSV